MSVIAYIGLGSNLGDAAANVRSAVDALDKLPRSGLQAVSDLFCTAPVDAGGGDFVNAVARISTSLAAEDLLAGLREIEASAGRERPYRNAPRTLDLDLLLYGAHVIDTPTLTVPHPRMTERAFVLIPLLQLDPFIAIPGKGAAHYFVPGVAGQQIARLVPPNNKH